jgi:uncharacterized YigZ family protein
LNKDNYFSIEEPAEGLYVEKGSKFFSYIFPFSVIDELSLYINDLKIQHPKARHFCYAYRIGLNGDLYKSNDDGEPSGSAGKPIMNVLLSNQLSDVLLVVVRYFGGTLLGVPGLIKAYKAAADEAIISSKIIEITIEISLEIKFDVARTNQVMMLLKQFGIHKFTQAYAEKSIINCKIRKGIKEEIGTAFQTLWDVELLFEDDFLGTGS